MNHAEIISTRFINRLADPRQTVRYDMPQLLAVTDRGTGKVLNISERGMAFGCLYPHRFGEYFHLDLLDAYGTHLVKLPVRKVWEKYDADATCSGEFELVVGLQFLQLSKTQEEGLQLLRDFASPYQPLELIGSELY